VGEHLDVPSVPDRMGSRQVYKCDLALKKARCLDELAAAETDLQRFFSPPESPR
jgi:hypothetical protein